MQGFTKKVESAGRLSNRLVNFFKRISAAHRDFANLLFKAILF
jgi:hypothetical protein